MVHLGTGYKEMTIGPGTPQMTDAFTSLTLLNGYCMLLFLDIVNSPPLNESVKFVNLQRKSIGLLFTRKAIG